MSLIMNFGELACFLLCFNRKKQEKKEGNHISQFTFLPDF